MERFFAWKRTLKKGPNFTTAINKRANEKFSSSQISRKIFFFFSYMVFLGKIGLDSAHHV